jgi:hypothetical protein
MPSKAEVNVALATHVRGCWQTALSERQTNGAQERLLHCWRAFEGQPITGSHMNADYPVVMNVVAPIVRVMEGLYKDAITQVGSDLFDLEATDVPDLPEDVQDQIVAALQTELTMRSMMGVEISQEEMDKLTEQLVAQAGDEMRRRASLGAGKLKPIIMDYFTEQVSREKLGKLVSNFLRYPAAFVRVNAFERKPVRKWEGGQFRITQEISRTVTVPSPLNVFPSKGALDTQTCDYVIEYRPSVTGQELADLAATPGYDYDGVKQVFEQYPKGYREDMRTGTQQDFADPGGSSSTVQDGLYDILHFNGRIPGWMLENFGVVVGNPQAVYESEVLIIGGVTIRAATSPTPDGSRSLRSFTYESSDGSLWGHCPVSRLLHLQRICTSSVVNALEEMAFAGAHIELDLRRISPDESVDPRMARARRVRLVKPDASGNDRPAYRITEVETQARVFYDIYERFKGEAMDAVGLSRLAAGLGDVGTVGRTSGGVAAVLNQSTKSVKLGLQAFEQGAIEPIAQAEVDWNLAFNPKVPAVTDARVRARGITQLVDRAQQASDLEWALQSISSIAGKTAADGTELVPASAITLLLYKLFQAKGVPTAGVLPDYDAMDSAQVDNPGAAPPRYNSGGPTLDGRSANAAAAIQAANSPMGTA